MEVTSSKDRRSRVTGILWGQAKSGKTTLLTSLPGKKLFVMIDPDGDFSIPDSPDIDIMRLYDQDPDVVKRFVIDKLPSYIKEHPEYVSVVIDSLTTFGQIALDEAIRSKVGASRDFTPTMEAPGLGAYGARKQYIVHALRNNLKATASVGAHCFFTAHEGEREKNSKGESIGDISMSLSDKTTNEVGLTVSELWHLRKKDTTWTLSISPCRGRSPMGSRLFTQTGEPEFVVKFNPEEPLTQPHSIASWIAAWEAGGRKKLPLPI